MYIQNLNNKFMIDKLLAMCGYTTYKDYIKIKKFTNKYKNEWYKHDIRVDNIGRIYTICNISNYIKDNTNIIIDDPLLYSFVSHYVNDVIIPIIFNNIDPEDNSIIQIISTLRVEKIKNQDHLMLIFLKQKFNFYDILAFYSIIMLVLSIIYIVLL